MPRPSCACFVKTTTPPAAIAKSEAHDRAALSAFEAFDAGTLNKDDALNLMLTKLRLPPLKVVALARLHALPKVLGQISGNMRPGMRSKS